LINIWKKFVKIEKNKMDGKKEGSKEKRKVGKRMGSIGCLRVPKRI